MELRRFTVHLYYLLFHLLVLNSVKGTAMPFTSHHFLKTKSKCEFKNNVYYIPHIRINIFTSYRRLIVPLSSVDPKLLKLLW